ncbi:hypothetical protein ABFS82_09G128300 [Erythranthe guttata]|uniref:Remorin C-terminal domain-containing protein n=1 Tax=Erythranthe guttata TaxID=4155 RepID=A0A022Q435_ERYGU|nr:hypothetical protein MIMGU_mgv1a005607mg [Erythranthe guttata]
MDLTSRNYLEPSTLFSSQVGARLESSNALSKTSKSNPFLDSFSDPLCKLNLKETSDFVKSFPMANSGIPEISAHRGGENGVNSVTKRNVEAPPTPGRPVFSFSTANYSRKSFPSKWDDAEKWLAGGNSCHDSPANNNTSYSHGVFKALEPSRMFTRQCSGYKPQLGDIFAEKSRITDEKVSTFQATLINGGSLSPTAQVLLKDKFPNELNQTSPKLGCSEPMQEGFLFRHSVKQLVCSNKTAETVVEEVKHRDVGTEMTPLGSSTTSRCPTPFLSTSPARHNTPANRSGPLAPTGENTIDITQLQECHLTKLHFGTQFDSANSNWSSREEEEEDVSKSLRHFEMINECRKSVSDTTKPCSWEEEEKTKSCLRYQREEAKIQAWVNHQSAKAEAESRKLEVKIQRMRSNMEEKLMKKMADVNRKAEEWRATAQFQHSEQIRKVGQQAREVMNRRNNSHFSRGHKSCGCFPCNNNNNRM